MREDYEDFYTLYDGKSIMAFSKPPRNKQLSITPNLEIMGRLESGVSIGQQVRVKTNIKGSSFFVMSDISRNEITIMKVKRIRKTRTLPIENKYFASTKQPFRKPEPLLFQGLTWEQMNKGERIRSLRWCYEHIDKRGHVHAKFIQAWYAQFWGQLSEKTQERIIKEI